MYACSIFIVSYRPKTFNEIKRTKKPYREKDKFRLFSVDQGRFDSITEAVLI